MGLILYAFEANASVLEEVQVRKTQSVWAFVRFGLQRRRIRWNTHQKRSQRNYVGAQFTLVKLRDSLSRSFVGACNARIRRRLDKHRLALWHRLGDAFDGIHIH